MHVDYYQLVDAPEAVMPAVFAALDLDWTPAVEQRIRSWREANPKGKRGTHEYRLLFTPASEKGDYINTAERRFKIKFVPPAPRRAKPPAVTYTAGPTVTTTSTTAQIACTGLNCRPSH